MSGKKKKLTETGKKKVKKDPFDVQLDPEVVAFSNWFVDWLASSGPSRGRGG